MLLFFSHIFWNWKLKRWMFSVGWFPKLYYGKVFFFHHFHPFSQGCFALDLPSPNLTSRFPMWEIVSQKNGWTLESGGSSTCTFIIDFLQRGTEEFHGFFSLQNLDFFRIKREGWSSIRGVDFFNPWKTMILVLLATPRKINGWNLQNHPFRKENDLPNLHDYIPCNLQGLRFV